MHVQTNTQTYLRETKPILTPIKPQVLYLQSVSIHVINCLCLQAVEQTNSHVLRRGDMFMLQDSECVTRHS